jgi:hypothetical protein
MTPRLGSSVLVSGLIRKAQAEGGFAAVLARGDADSGSVLVILAERGGDPRLFERVLQPNGTYSWASVCDGERVPEFVARRRRFDPDSWAIELDVPCVERFAAEMNSLD